MVNFSHQSLRDGLATLYSHLPSQINPAICNQKQINKPNPNSEVSTVLSESKSENYTLQKEFGFFFVRRTLAFCLCELFETPGEMECHAYNQTVDHCP